MNALKFRTSRSLAARIRLATGHAVRVLACLCVCVAFASRANAEERRFAVKLAHAPKSFTNLLNNEPVGGLTSAETIRRLYFDLADPNTDSFAEYWEEISYGDVVIQGDALPWVLLPWAFAPDGPNMAPRNSPENFIDLDGNQSYSYGTSERICEDSDSGILCTPLLVATDFADDVNLEQGGRGFSRAGGVVVDGKIAGAPVWTPGERFRDLDGDGAWDGLDELNDEMCYGGDGCTQISPEWGVCTVFCDTDADCPADAFGADYDGPLCIDGRCLTRTRRVGCLRTSQCTEAEPRAICAPDPMGIGSIGCSGRGCGSLDQPWVDWDQNNTPENCTDACETTLLTPCVSDGQCVELQGLRDYYQGPLCIDGYCIPDSCAAPLPNTDCAMLPDCCTPESGPDDDCADGIPGITCLEENQDPIVCCEFEDYNRNGECDAVEPFEDYMIRHNPSAGNVLAQWVRVSGKYVFDNYPGDVEAVISRTGNLIFDSPDSFANANSTKMIRDSSFAKSAWRVPKPGKDPAYAVAPIDEEPWFDAFWTERYGSDVPPWPGSDGIGGDGPNGPPNNIVMVEFLTNQPNSPIFRDPEGAPGTRAFSSNRGTTSNQPATTGPIVPDDFGYFDGWVEHDDLASSRYHSRGDQRLGEITSPLNDFVDPVGPAQLFPAIFGDDLGPNDPRQAAVDPDEKLVAAGPGARNIHGNFGFDAGDVCITEWMTWRTDGESRTSGVAWSRDYETPHPYAGAKVCEGSSWRTGIELCRTNDDCTRFGPTCIPAKGCSNSFRICRDDGDCGIGGECIERPVHGFADYNLDGLIDQGEVRPAVSENYSVDANFRTTNNGTSTDYPFNRTRLMEDVVEALDNGVNWKVEFESDLERSGRSVSGIILTPPGGYVDINRFPQAPSLDHPVLTNDDDVPILFHDLVICQDCRDEPAAIGYAAHEYLHTWEGYPDLYDYDVFQGPQTIINCPIGDWDIMSGSRGDASLVHPVAPLKEFSDWVEGVDIRTVLTPGVETTLTLPPAELDRQGYYFLENEDAPKRCTNSSSASGEPLICETDADCSRGAQDRCVRGERYYFWSAGFDETFDVRFPGEGMLILKTTQVFAEAQALSEQQRRAPYNWEIVQADGRNDLDACSSTGNSGDDGDIWPGATNNQDFDFELSSNPRAVWNSQGRWTGLDVNGVSEMDSSGAVRLTLSWQPTNIPSLRFLEPPGGESFNDAGRQVYSVRYEATDVGGETRLEFYYTEDPETDGTPIDFSIDPTRLIRGLTKGTGGTGEGSFRWDVTDIADGRYRFFAKLEPFGSERKSTAAIPARGNLGDGTVQILEVDAGSADSDKARSETWSIVCIDPDGDEWVVFSSLTEPLPEDVDPLTLTPATTCMTSNDRACTGDEYESRGSEVRFIINEGAVPFALGDRFVFTTTGITAASEPVTVIDGAITLDPSAQIVASVLSGRPPLIVDFVVDEPVNPTGGPLRFEWDFNDPTSGQPTAVGQAVRHTFEQPGTFSVVLRVVDASTGRFSTDSIDIQVINNRPNAAITAAPRSGSSPLVVNFNGAGSSDQESGAAGLTYSWDFGDGNTAVGAQPGLAQAVSNTYNCPGGQVCKFNVTLTVADPGGLTDTATTSITVGNTFPVAFVTATPRDGRRPLTVVFNAINSSDPDGDALTVNWDFGDGTTLTDHPITGDSGEIGGAVRHTYMTSGVFTAEARVKDDAGGVSNPVQIRIEVFDPSVVNGIPVPRLAIRPSDTRQAGQVFEFDASSSSDPDGDALSFAWNFGDNTTATGAQTSHSYSTVGRFEVVLDVTDEFGGTASLSRFVRVTEAIGNSAPTAIIATPPVSATAGQTLRFDGSLSFDPDGDELDYIWDFFDSDGETVDRLLGEVITRTFNDVGTFDIVLTVRDGRGGESQSEPARVSIGAAQDGGGPTDPEPEQPEPGDNGNGEPPDSSNQRPGVSVCGLGMIFGFFGSMAGLFLIGVTRKRRTM